MTVVRLGLGLSARLWQSPLGLLLAGILLLSGPVLTGLAPTGPIHEELGGGEGLVGLALFAGSALALGGLGRRASFLELLPIGSRLLVQATACLACALEGVLLCALGAGALCGWVLPVFGAPPAALSLTGLALPLLALRLRGTSRVAVFLAAAWWAPALVLGSTGWQAAVRNALTPIQGLSLSESPEWRTMLAPTLLGLAVLVTGAMTARSVSRIR